MHRARGRKLLVRFLRVRDSNGYCLGLELAPGSALVAEGAHRLVVCVRKRARP
jgi:hypothetical protein